MHDLCSLLSPVYATKYYLGYQIENNERGGACSTWGRGEVHNGFWWGNLREINHMEVPGIDGRIVLRWMFRKRDAGHDLD
jgi:hypothetical protein